MIFLQICHKSDEPANYLRPFSPLIVTKTVVNSKQTSLRMSGLFPGVALKLLPIDLSGPKTYPLVNCQLFIISSHFVEVMKI